MSSLQKALKTITKMANIITDFGWISPQENSECHCLNIQNLDYSIDIAAKILLSSLFESGNRLVYFLLQSMGSYNLVEFIFRYEDYYESKYLRDELIIKYSLDEKKKEIFESRVFAKTLLESRNKINHKYLLNCLLVSKNFGYTPITISHYLWPHQICDLDYLKPIILWLRGNEKELLKTPISKIISVVGSRSASTYGEYVTSDFVSEWTNESYVIVSGGAYGIDAIAHRTALNVGGKTFAVMAGGVDRLYPSSNYNLFQRIENNGLIISEFLPGTRPTRWRFLMRNRIIAALGSSVIITEAGKVSGSLNTARHALSIGRNLYAVPGSVSSTSSLGCNLLIKDGLAESLVFAKDIYHNNEQYYENINTRSSDNINERLVIDAMSINHAKTIEKIAVEASLSIDKAIEGISILFSKNKVIESEEGWRIKK